MKLGYAHNSHGTLVSVHRCSACGDAFTLCPPCSTARWGTGCLSDECSSYDVGRDAGLIFDQGSADIVQLPNAIPEGGL